MTRKKKTVSSLTAKKLTLSILGSKMIRDALESKQKGYELNEIRILWNVLDKFSKQVENFEKEQKDLIRDGENKFSVTKDVTEQMSIRREVESKSYFLEEEASKELIDYILESKELKLIDDVWQSMSGLRGNRASVKLIIEITDALENVEDVDLEPKE